MLSKIVTGEQTEKLLLEPFRIPSANEVSGIIADRKREMERRGVIEDNKEDPIKAAQKEANNILIEAQEKLKEAEVEANVLKNRKEKEIRAKLEAEFQTKLNTEVKKIHQSYMDSLELLGALKQVLYKKSENQLMQLVFSVCKKVMENEIRTSPEVVLSLLKKGFEKIKDAKEYEIKINPADFTFLENKRGEINELLKGAGAIKFTKDEQIERGGSIIITEHGEISSEPGRQLDIIMRELSNGA